MKNLLALFVLIFMTGCEMPFNDLSTKDKIINKIEFATNKQVKEQLGLIPCGDSAQAMDQIKMLGLIFNCYKQIDIDEGRFLTVSAMNIFLEKINTHSEIRPFLANYPFEAKNIQIMIDIRKPDGKTADLNNITIIYAYDGKIHYNVRERAGQPLVTKYEETYSEAVEKLKAATNY